MACYKRMLRDPCSSYTFLFRTSYCPMLCSLQVTNPFQNQNQIQIKRANATPTSDSTSATSHCPDRTLGLFLAVKPALSSWRCKALWLPAKYDRFSWCTTKRVGMHFISLDQHTTREAVVCISLTAPPQPGSSVAASCCHASH